MTDMELAEEIERGELVVLALTVQPEIKAQIIAALRRGHERRLPSLPHEIQEWCWHMDLHLTEHDERHAGLALRAAWPHVSEWLKSVVGPSNIQGVPLASAAEASKEAK